jgi:hypothetical protein
MRSAATALGGLKCFDYLRKAPAAGLGGVGKFLNLPNHMRRAEGQPFPLPSVGWVPVPPACHTQTCARALRSTIEIEAAHCDRLVDERATNKPSDRGARPVESFTDCSFGGRDRCGLDAAW